MTRPWNLDLTGLAFGGDYNPEQWPAEVWDEDVRLMGEAGVNLVSVAIFAWARIEPLPGQYDWDWLDQVLDKLHGAGIKVALATATASPPPWLTAQHPEILPQTADGVVLSPGARQAYAVTSPTYRRHALELARRLAERYAQHPAVVLWHVDNELGCHVPADYSDDAAAAFRVWLAARYQTIEGLNEAWGTSFWSQRYASFDHVLPPRTAPTFANPCQQLDWARFCSDTYLAWYRELRAVLREVAPEVPATTNFMCNTGNKAIDYLAWGPEMDVVANDHYTRSSDANRQVELAFSADLTRGAARQQPWLLMEHSTSAVNWQPHNRAKEPGEMLRNSLAHLARGADGVMFFQWRASRAGAEKFHSAMLPHAGVESQTWRETVQLGQVVAALGPVRDSVVRSRVALVFDYQNWWAVELDSHPVNDLRYPELVLEWYRALYEEGHQVDLVSPTDDLAAYQLVVAPNLYLTDPAAAANLAGVVERGGVFATTWFSGIVDGCDRVHLGGYPGAFRELLGVRSDRFCPLLPDEQVEVVPDSLDGLDGHGTDNPLLGHTWSEPVELQGATARARFASGPLAGGPAVTERVTAEGGHAWYLATDLPLAGKRQLVSTWASQAGVSPVLDEPQPGLEAVRRHGAEFDFLFLLNHAAHEVVVPARGLDLVTGHAVDGTIKIPAGGVAVVREG